MNGDGDSSKCKREREFWATFAAWCPPSSVLSVLSWFIIGYLVLNQFNAFSIGGVARRYSALMVLVSHLCFHSLLTIVTPTPSLVHTHTHLVHTYSNTPTYLSAWKARLKLAAAAILLNSPLHSSIKPASHARAAALFEGSESMG